MPTKRFHSLDRERRAHLLDAAATEFAANGYEGTSFKAIIERAGTSKGVIYYYFEDKADLYATVASRAIADFVAACGPVSPVDDASSFWVQVELLVRRSLVHYASHPHLAGLIRSLARDGLAFAPVDEIRALSQEWFATWIRQGQQVGAVRTDIPLDLILAVVTSMSEGIDVWLADRITELDGPALDELADIFIDFHRRLAAPPEALP